MKASVVVSTYNSPDWLRKVLWGYSVQTFRDFELLIADDGSSEETGDTIAEMARSSPVPIVHVWQPDAGFQKCRILNKTLAVARGERIIVSDGDCVPRSDFVASHMQLARPGSFLTGTYFKLPLSVSTALTKDVIQSQRAFRAGWLLRQGVPISGKFLKLVARPPFDGLLNRVTPARPTWNGHSASCLRSEAIRVNGFNERMQYGGLDVEFGLRLNHIGLATRHIRYSTIALHLHHGHGYVTDAMRARSEAEKDRTRSLRLLRAEQGLDQWLGPDDYATLANEDRVIRYGPLTSPIPDTSHTSDTAA